MTVKKTLVKKSAGKKTTGANLLANLTLHSKGKQALAREQIELLAAIDRSGSISAAAKAVAVSYKTAWDRVDAMNNMAAKPLVTRAAGGSHGGGTQLTEFGRRVLEGFLAIEAEHEAYVQRLGKTVKTIDDVAGFIQLGTLKTSARNQLRGVVRSVTAGAVNASVVIDINDEQILTVIVTEESRKQLGLKKGLVVVALIKSSSVMLSTDRELKVSARNKLMGRISRLTKGAVNSDVTVDIGGSKTVSAMITNASVVELALTEGDQVCAFFKASSVILLVD